MTKTKRLDVKVIFACNNFCRHCAQGHRRNYRARSTEELKKEILKGYKEGCREIVFTGGEPTIRKDLLELVEFSKELGYKNIQIQTNCRMFSDKKFLEKFVEAGITEVSPALHGHTPKIHNYITRAEGSWEQTVQGIKNVREYGDITIVTNTVVTRLNYRWLKEIAEFLVSLYVDQYQLAFVHPCGNAWENFDEVVPYISLASEKIKEGLDPGINAGLLVMAEAIPFCLMEGYEQYVSEIYIPPARIVDADKIVPDFHEAKLSGGKFKPSRCSCCKYYNVCEGVWMEYAVRRGTRELCPVC